MAMSNNHVLANSDTGMLGEPILQPGPIDGGTDGRNVVGYLHEYLSLESGFDVAFSNLLEYPSYTGYNGYALTGVTQAELGAPVWKVGRTTGVTLGRVTAVAMDDVPVQYPNGTRYFNDQIEITGDHGPFSAGGDSGSLILDAHNRAVGLLFAGSSGPVARTWANPLLDVLRACEATLYF
jgi:hypothetical protein